MASPSPRRTSSAPVINIENDEHELEVSPEDDEKPSSSIPDQHAEPNSYGPRRNLHRMTSQPQKKRKHSPSPGVEWKEKWNSDSFKSGRVLMLDYVSRDFSEDGRRRILANELRDIDQLRHFYRYEEPKRHPALRVIHVQNSWWARRFLLRKFNIDPTDDLIGMSFGKWAAFTTPQRRAGRPMLNGKAFRNQRDPWRGISRCAFGVDYLKYYHCGQCDPSKDGFKMMELNGFDTKGDPAYLNDVYVQRISVYVQKNDGEPRVPTDPDLRNPYSTTETEEQDRIRRRYSKMAREADLQADDYVPILKSLDNNSTIIIFEDSQTGSTEDTVIGARQEIENRWRRLTFYLPKEELDEEQLALECMNLILNDVFKALSTSWEKYLHKSAAHVSILEDKIYEQPADESRAPELWLNSSTWLKVERLVYTHQDVVKEVKVYLNSLFDTDPPHGEWLGSTLEDYERIEHLVQEDLVKPTQSLNDLMYKSVEIRDSRHSLQLGTSMWRLSWITFIFLPLTFLVSFFGMNVDTFQDGTPSIKWWFIVAVPMMLLVLALWYIVKHMLAQRRQDPLVRGTYEHLFHDFSTEHPTLWSRNGPREYVEPTGRVSRWKWYLLTKWFAPAKTIAARGYDQDIDGLGAWARVKRSLAIRWLPGITVANATKPSAEEEGTELSDTLYEEGQGTAMEPGGDFDAIKDALRYANRVGIAEAEPKIAIDPGLSPPPSRASRSRARSKRSRTTSPKQSGDGRPGSQSSGSCMITEEQIGSEGDGNESDAGASGGHGRPNSAPEGGRGRERGLGLLDVPGSDSQSHGPIGIDGRMM